MHAFDRALEAPRAAQEETRRRILGFNRDTEYGREHGFAELGDYDTFCRRVPIVQYDQLEPYVSRMIHGEANVLVADPVLYLGVSSGTTGGKKYIPIQASFADETELWMALERSFLARAHPGFEKLVELRYVNRVEGKVPCGLPAGAVSAWYYSHLQASGRYAEIVPLSAYQLGPVAARNYAVLRFALGAAVGRMTAVNPSTLLLLARTLAAETENLIRDVRDGDIRHAELPDDVRAELRGRLSPDAERARDLEAAVESGRLVPARAWPSLRFISCWMHAGASLYAADLAQEIGKLPVWDYGYTSTEGRVTVTVDDAGRGVPLITSAFFELRDGDGHVMPLVEAQPGQQGEMIITSSRGLYRYATGDVVEIAGTNRATPLVKYERKLRATASLTGEKLTEVQVLSVVQSVLGEAGIVPEFFCLCAEWGSPPRYVLALEPRGAPPSDDVALAVADHIEQGLCKANPEYEKKRETQRLNEVAILVLEPGSRQAYIEQERRGGREVSRIKLPCLSMDLGVLARFNGRRIAR